MRTFCHTALVFMVATAPAVAETAKERAAAIYQEGVAAFRAGDFPKALELFDKAYKLDPSPILIYNLARTHEEMGNAAQAVEHFELYLAREPDSPDRADIETRIRVTRKLLEQQQPAAATVGRLGVVSEPPGAAVHLDGALLEQAAPLEIEVTAGPHRLRLELPGYLPQSRDVAVDAGGRVAVAVQLMPAPVADAAGTGWQRPVAYGSFAAGAVAAGLAGYFYYRASDVAGEAAGLRGEPARHVALEDDFDAAALGMWISTGAAVLFTGLGTTLLLTAPEAPGASAGQGGPVFAW